MSKDLQTFLGVISAIIALGTWAALVAEYAFNSSKPNSSDDEVNLGE